MKDDTIRGVCLQCFHSETGNDMVLFHLRVTSGMKCRIPSGISQQGLYIRHNITWLAGMTCVLQRKTNTIAWLSLQFSKHCWIHWLQIHWNQFVVLNSNYPELCKHHCNFRRCHSIWQTESMTINFEYTTEVTTSRTMLSIWWCNFLSDELCWFELLKMLSAFTTSYSLLFWHIRSLGSDAI